MTLKSLFNLVNYIDKAYREKARQEPHKNVRGYIEQILEATSQETTIVLPPTSYL